MPEPSPLRRKRARERKAQPLVITPLVQLGQHAVVRQREHLMFERLSRARQLGPKKWGGNDTISLADFLACERFEKVCVRADGCLVTGERTERSDEDRFAEHGILQAQLDAASEVSAIEAGIGRPITKLLRLALVEDLTWTALAKHCGVQSHDTARRWTLGAIADLTAWYEAFDNSRKKRRPVPAVATTSGGTK